MAALSSERVTATSSVKDATSLSVHSASSIVTIQADTADVRYTMDGTTVPSTTVGLVFSPSHEPAEFIIEDLKRIQFTRGTGSDGALNIHYFGGRNI